MWKSNVTSCLDLDCINTKSCPQPYGTEIQKSFRNGKDHSKNMAIDLCIEHGFSVNWPWLQSSQILVDIFSLWSGMGVPKHFDPNPKWGATNTKNVYIKKQKVDRISPILVHMLWGKLLTEIWSVILIGACGRSWFTILCNISLFLNMPWAGMS